MAESTTPTVKTIGYIGLGNAGFPLASQLSRSGYTLIVRDADSDIAA